MDVGKIREAPRQLASLRGHEWRDTDNSTFALLPPKVIWVCDSCPLFLSMTWGRSATRGGGGTRQQEKGETTSAQAGKGKGREGYMREKTMYREDGTTQQAPHFFSLLLRTTSQILSMQMNLKCCYNSPASGRSKWGYGVAQVRLCVLVTVLFKKGGKRERNKVSLYGRRQMPWVIVYIGIQLTDHKSRSICQQTKLLLSFPLHVSPSFSPSLLSSSFVCYPRTFCLPFTNYIRLSR